VFSLRYDPSVLRPALQGAVAELGEHPGGRAGLRNLRLCLCRVHLGQEAAIFGEAKDIVKPVGCTPRHERLTAEAGIGA
jgi:hypothetical protein